jgi:toxin YhaV
MSAPKAKKDRPFAVRNGWTLLRHPQFREPFDGLVAKVARLKAADPEGWSNHPKAKMLKRISDLIMDEIPANPDHPDFRLGNTMGKQNSHWRRAKFLGRFRLFYRFDTAAKIIIYVWVNDENTQRKAGSKTDPYAVFEKRLSRGDPPGGWAELRASVLDDPAAEEIEPG